MAIHGGNGTGVLRELSSRKTDHLAIAHRAPLVASILARTARSLLVRLENAPVHRRLLNVNRSHRLHCMAPLARFAKAGRRGVVPAAGAGTHPWPTALSSARRFTPIPR